MNTSLSTGCVVESSSRDTLGISPNWELFQGTSTSDFGASSLPRIEMPDIFTSPVGGAASLPAAAGSAVPSGAFAATVVSTAALAATNDFFDRCLVASIGS